MKQKNPYVEHRETWGDIGKDNSLKTIKGEIMERLEEQLIRHEGVRYKPYICPKGKLTIGVGRNLDELGLSHDEILYLLRNDIDRCKKELSVNFDFFPKLDTFRRRVLINMCFNLGISRLKRFKRMIAAIRKCDWKQAAKEMLNSRWHEQVGARAKELAKIMETGRLNNG